MPLVSAKRVRNIRPCAFSAGVSVTSTSITCAPRAVISFKVSSCMAWAECTRPAASKARTTRNGAARRAAQRKVILVLDEVRSMLGRQAGSDPVGAKLGRHAALGAHAPAHLHDLIGSQLGEAEAPQSLHVDKDIRSAFATRQKPKSTDPIEPLYSCPLPVALGNNLHVRALRQLRGMDG